MDFREGMQVWQVQWLVIWLDTFFQYTIFFSQDSSHKSFQRDDASDHFEQELKNIKIFSDVVAVVADFRETRAMGRRGFLFLETRLPTRRHPFGRRQDNHRQATDYNNLENRRTLEVIEDTVRQCQ